MDKEKIKFLIDSISVLLGELADEIKKDDSSSEKKKKKKKKNQKVDKSRLWDCDPHQDNVEYYEENCLN